jgi:hypothetical protein
MNELGGRLMLNAILDGVNDALQVARTSVSKGHR